MANKVLTVEINADTGKFEAKVKEIPKLLETQVTVSEKLKVLEADRNANLAKQKELLVNVQNTLDKVSKYSEKFQLNALNAQLPSVNKKFQEIETTIKAINAEIVKTSRVAAEISLSKGALPTTQRAVASSSQGSAYFGGAAQKVAQVSQAVPKVDATTIKSAAPDLSYSLIAGATKSAAIIKEAQKSFADRIAATPVFKPSSDYAIQLTKGLSEAGRLANQTKQVVAEVATSQEKVKDKVNQTNTALDSTVTKHKNILLHVGEIILSYRTLNSAINLIQQGLLSIPKAGIEMQATQASIFGIFGSEEGAKNLQFVRETALNAGQSIKTLEEAYRRYAPSARLAGAEQDQINKSFKDFAEVATIMHLPEDRLNSLFLALDQMFAKGVVQSEEIKKQLGNVLPAAVELGAQSMGKSPAAFMEAMKKNEVIAKDFVPKFAALYRETFGGGDTDAVFKRVQDSLYANLQNIKNQWELLARDIFIINQDMMNNITKVVRDSLGIVRENLTGVGQAVEILGGLIAARLGIGLIEAAASIGTLVTKLTSFATIVTGLSAPVLAVGAAIVTLYGQVNDLSVSYEKATGFTVNYKDQTVSLTSYLETVGIKVIDSLKETFNDLASTLQNLIGIDVSSFWNSLLPGQDFLIGLAAHTKAIKESFSLNPYSPTYDEAFAKYRKEYEGKITSFQQGIIDTAKKRDTAKKQEAEAALAKPVIDPPKLAPVIESPVANKKAASAAAKAAKQAYRAGFEDIKQAAKEIQLDIQDSLGRIDSLYRENGISIKDYFNQKRSLQEADLSTELEMIKQEQAFALANGDKVKAGKLENDYLRAQLTAKKESIKTTQEQIAAEREYYALKVHTHAQFLELQGKGSEAAIAQFDITNRNTKEKLTTEGDKQAIKEFNTIRANVGLKATLVDLDNKRSIAEQQYQNDIDRTNILVNIGAKSSLSAARDIEEANKKIIALKEEQLSKMDEEIAKTKELGAEVDVNVTAQNEKLRNEIEKLKLTADTTAQYFSRVMGSAFENSFAAFVTGSQTASQAFSSFASSVVESIAKIIAEELKSQMLSLLFQAGKGILGSSGLNLGSLFGGGFSGVGPLQSFANPFANGGLASGLSSVSNTVLTKPTLFPGAKVIPFASGGVLAGEAGAEAVLPLKRGRNGKLGVAMEDGQQTSGGNIININVSVARSQGEDDSAYTAKIAEAIARRIAKEEVANGARTGNINNRITKFG